MIRRSWVVGVAGAIIVLLGSTLAAYAADPESGPPPTAAQQAANDARLAVALDWMAAKRGEISANAFNKKHASYAGKSLASLAANAGGEVSVLGLAGNIIAMTQKAQSNGTYCGPASGYEILKYLGGTTGPGGESLTQAHLAAKCTTGYMCTDSQGGTPWYVGSSYPDEAGYPVTSTLNRWAKTTWYDTMKGTGVAESSYESELVFDIDHTHPVAINIIEQASTTTPHLPGHPKDRVIQHWIAASGYSDYGNNTYYADSVYGSSVSWAGNLAHPFYYYSSANMYKLFAARGYVW